MASILVIAEARIGRRLVWLLAEAGHATQWTDDPADAIDVCTSMVPEVIVLDGAVPQGEKPAYSLRLKRLSPGVRIIDIAHQAGGAAFDVPADARLTQPFGADELLAAVEGSGQPS